MRTRNPLLITIATAVLVAAPLVANAQAAPRKRPAARPADTEMPPTGDEPAATRPAAPKKRAAARPAVSAEDKDKARKLFVKGSGLYQKAKYKPAIEAFTEAYKYWKNPKILLNIAICYTEDGDKVNAVIFLRKALASADAETAAKLRGGIPATLKKADKDVATLKIVMPDPAAEIFVNGDSVGHSPAEKLLLAGDAKVEVKLNGETKVTKTIKLAPGATETFELTSWPAPVGPKRPEPKRPDGPKKSWRRWAKLPMYYFAGAALLTLVGTAALIGTGVKTESIKDDYVANPTLDTRDKGIRYRTATNVLLGITVVAGVGTAVLGVLFTDWHWPPWKKKEKAEATTRLMPSVGPGGASFTLSGSF